MDMDPKVDWDVLVKMLQGTCSEQEKLQFDHWLAENVANRKFFEEMKLSWETSENVYDEYMPNLKKSWNKVELQISKKQTSGSKRLG